jgi:hypothetical protein
MVRKKVVPMADKRVESLVVHSAAGRVVQKAGQMGYRMADLTAAQTVALSAW